MSWIRIDDDTYIDDSLVTCAEYQLFIDEMRAQGKYHQPDHWKEYHFSKGHARQPILGMRHSDAILFCQWLTERNQDGWRYLLPNETQAQKHPLQKPYTPPIGYWLQGTGTARFAWVGAKPSNPHPILLARALTRALARDRALDCARARALDLDLARARALDLARYLERLHFRSIARDRALASALDLGLVRDLDMARDRALGLARDHSLGLARDRALYIALHIDIAPALALALALELYIDIVILQARINGTSPAFEGIRLVKERVR